MLHIHSTTREFAPNAHVFFIVAVQLLELLGLGIFYSRRPPWVPRLVYTTVLFVLLAAHYLATSLTGEYPILHSASRISELVVQGVIVLTIALHALTMYLVDGAVDVRRLTFSPTNFPRMSDDYAIASLKLGSACLHATHLTSLSCELTPLDAPLQTYVEVYASREAVVEHSLDDLEDMHKHGVNGLGKEVKDVRMVLDRDAEEIGGVVRGIDKLREGWHFVYVLFEVLWQLASAVLGHLFFWVPAPPLFVRRIPRYVRLFWHGTNGEEERERRIATERAHREQAQSMQQRLTLLRARQRHDELSAVRAPWPHVPAGDTDPVELLALAAGEQPGAGFHDIVVQHMMRPEHAPPLTRRKYRKIAPQHEPEPTQDASARSWLSRPAPSSSDAADRQMQQALFKLLQERKTSITPDPAAREHERERTRLCVVCCSEDRTIICWPCRCLALCDDCREALAAQINTPMSITTSGGRTVQLCPTCRTPVLAFSRLYIP